MGTSGILDLPSLAAILFFTYNEPCYLTVIFVVTIFVFVTTCYILHSNLLDQSIFIAVLTVLLLRFFEQESVQPCLHMLEQVVLTSRRISEGTMKTKAGWTLFLSIDQNFSLRNTFCLSSAKPRAITMNESRWTSGVHFTEISYETFRLAQEGNRRWM